MTFKFQLTYTLHVIDVNLIAEHTTANNTLHADKQSYTFTLSWGIEHSCFVALIREKPNVFNDDVHIRLTFGNRLHGLIAGPIILLLIFAATITVLAVTYRRVSHQMSYRNTIV